LNDTAKKVADVAEQYYDSDEADRFYFNIWGGEDIHVGLYDDVGSPPIRDASARTVARMASLLEGLGEGSEMLDIGAGYGGAARFAAKSFGCNVACLNISEIQNERNRQINREQGLDDKVRVVHGSFEDIPEKDGSFDVVWSQDAILHSGNRRRVLEEVARVLRPGGQLVFTDPMQSDDCPDGVLGPVLARIHLDTLGSFAFYRKHLRELGFEERNVLDLTEQLVRHYSSVRQELQTRYDEMTTLSTKAYVDRMIEGLGHWIEAGQNGYLAWGILHFVKG
jgi:cyclopropane fatty-acyl-phospholipid synthase-like methyltransferase